MNAPAGWDATANGGPRHRAGAAAWVGWGGLCLVALLGAASSGVSGLFTLSGLYMSVVAVVALVRGRVPWARLRSRAAGGAALGVAVALAFVGAATANPQGPAPLAAPTSSGASPVPTTASPS